MGPNFLMNTVSMGPSLPVDLNRSLENGRLGELSETEGFDFKNYVLGLQMEFPGFSTPDAEDVLQSAVSTELTGPTASDALNASAMLEKNPLNALFPVLATPQNSMLTQLETAQKPESQPTLSVDWKALGLSDMVQDLKSKNETDAAHIFQLFARAYQGEEKDLIPKANLKDIKSVQMELLPEEEMPFAKEPLTADRISPSREESFKVDPQTSPEVKEKTIALKPKVELAKEVHSSEQPESFSTLVSPVEVKTAQAPTVAMEISKPQAGAVTTQTWIPQAESLARQGGGKMTVALTPPELGQIEIEVTTRGKNVEIAMRSDNEGAKRVLESGLSELKTALLGHDLVLAKSEVKVAPSERFFLDGMSAQSFNSNLTSQDRQSSRDNPTFSRPKTRWEQADLISTKSAAAVASFVPRSSSRLDVRI